MKTNLRKFIAFTILALAVILLTQMTVLADNTSNQSASTAKATTITVVDKTGDVAITTITFPEAAVSATVTVPYNNENGDGDPQVVAGSNSEPVVRLKNTSGGALDAWLSIGSWTESAVIAEDYELVSAATTDVATVDDVLSADGATATVDTNTEVAAGGYMCLYLGIDLGSLAGKTGTSTLTILGETQ